MFKDIKKYFIVLGNYTASEGVYILIGVIAAVISQVCALITPFLTRFLIDNIIAQKNYYLLLQFLFFCLCILVVLFVSVLIGNYFLIRSFRKGGLKFRFDIFKNLQFAPLEFFGKTSSGEITYRLLQDASVVETSWSNILVTLPLQIVLLLSGLFMVIWDFNLALFVFLILGLQVIIIIKFREPLLRYSLLTKSKEQEFTGYTVAHFQRIQLVRSLSTEREEQIKFYKKFHELIKLTIRAFMLGKFSNATVTTVNNLWAFGILWYGGGQVIANKMTLGTLMAFLLFAHILYQPISTLTNLVLSFQDIRASLNRCLEYLNLKPNVLESPNAIGYVPKRGIITLKNVSFSYNSHPVLKQINLEIPANKIFALVGRSGVGKTTLCRLLVRFYEPNEGTILLDGKDIKTYTLSALRKSVLFMLQNDYVFPGTIWENITYGLKSISQEDVYKAVKDAGIDFIELLPDGYETRIGEGGMNLSVGQAQRIALARAFLIKPKVLILDEPTAFVDNETEEKIKNSLSSLKKTSTIIIIAHTITTVRMVDKIAVMNNGEIIETGTHEELIANPHGIYRRIYQSILTNQMK